MEKLTLLRMNKAFMKYMYTSLPELASIHRDNPNRDPSPKPGVSYGRHLNLCALTLLQVQELRA